LSVLLRLVELLNFLIERLGISDSCGRRLWLRDRSRSLKNEKKSNYGGDERSDADDAVKFPLLHCSPPPGKIPQLSS
jgi:hypothetical protein